MIIIKTKKHNNNNNNNNNNDEDNDNNTNHKQAEFDRLSERSPEQDSVLLFMNNTNVVQKENKKY